MSWFFPCDFNLSWCWLSYYEVDIYLYLRLVNGLAHLIRIKFHKQLNINSVRFTCFLYQNVQTADICFNFHFTLSLTLNASCNVSNFRCYDRWIIVENVLHGPILAIADICFSFHPPPPLSLSLTNASCNVFNFSCCYDRWNIVENV